MKPAMLKKYNGVPAAKPTRLLKVYEGRRVGGNTIVTVNTRMLPDRHDLAFHSPTGFEWGYGGSGPAQLALALLADHLGNDQRALDLHQEFKFKVIAALPYHWWKLTSQDVEKFLKRIEVKP